MGRPDAQSPWRPVCSVIIPAFNADRYLAEAIDSALAQTYAPIELVVVDDGSTDRTPELIESYGDKVVHLRQSNRGLAGARNTGVARATGEVIAFLDADDAWEPERLARCMEVLSATADRMVTTDAFLLEDDARTNKRFYGDFNPIEFPNLDQQLQEISRRNFIFVSVVVRRAALQRVGPFDESLRRAEDYDMWIRLLLDGNRVDLIREPLAWYRCRADSLSANRPEQWDAHLTVLEKHLPELWAQGVRAPSATYFEIAGRLARRHQRAAAARFAAMAVRAPELSPTRKLRAAARVGVEIVTGSAPISVGTAGLRARPRRS